MPTDPSAAKVSPKLPLWIKLSYTAFVAVLVPYYWHEYGPTNFLYFCDVALFLALLTCWTERPIYASMAAIGISIPQLLWQVDFIGHGLGFPVAGMTEYMFDSGISLFARGLSFFHFWLPLMLIFFLWRLGYDRRALPAWSGLAWILILTSYFVLPPAGAVLDYPNQPHNVNYVFGMNDAEPQSWMPPQAWLTLLLVGLPTFVYLPTHLLFSRLFSDRDASGIEPDLPDVDVGVLTGSTDSWIRRIRSTRRPSDRIGLHERL
ncbi:hypothetical protein [Stieleria mannarensis]|uniref:hypothetical protein n=1 Tax=Stieleria mannarensis TaxID=2755585 RepID=UPI00256FFCFF|nr:hypothetical protein [Rhodopirellula sp. JC639]